MNFWAMCGHWSSFWSKHHTCGALWFQVTLKPILYNLDITIVILQFIHIYKILVMDHIFLSRLFRKDSPHPKADNWNENKANSCNLQQPGQLIEENYLKHLRFRELIFDEATIDICVIDCTTKYVNVFARWNTTWCLQDQMQHNVCKVK